MLPLLRRERSLKKWGLLSARTLLAMPYSLPPIPYPTQREVHFWYTKTDVLKSSSLFNQYLDILSPSERDGVLRMSGEKLQKDALLARALVRTTISRYTSCKVSPRSLKFKKNRFGKPEVDWNEEGDWIPPSLHFNVSHTSSLIACGVTAEMAIGIDVEEKARQLRKNILSFARRYFTPKEVDFLLALSNPEIQRQELIKIWTLKEAYVKALGRGFSAVPFRDFMIHFVPCKDVQGGLNSDATNIIVEPSIDSQILTTNWKFALFEVASSHYAAICMEKDDSIEGREEKLLTVKAWKTVPFLEDVYVSGTNEVVPLSGFS